MTRRSPAARTRLAVAFGLAAVLAPTASSTVAAGEALCGSFTCYSLIMSGGSHKHSGDASPGGGYEEMHSHTGLYEGWHDYPKTGYMEETAEGVHNNCEA